MQHEAARPQSAGANGRAKTGEATRDRKGPRFTPPADPMLEGAPPTAAPTRSGSRGWPRISWTLLFGVALLVGTVVAVVTKPWRSWGGSASGSESQAERRSVATAFVDVEGGPRLLYPTRHGRVVFVLENEEKEVEAGQLLLQVDDTQAKIDRDKAELALKDADLRWKQAKRLDEQHQQQYQQQEVMQRAAIAQVNAKIASAKAQAARVERLYDGGKGNKGGPTDVEVAKLLVKEAEAALVVEQAKLDLLLKSAPETLAERAKLDVDAKQKQLEEARFGVEQFQVKAPCRGKILRRIANVGEVLGPNPKLPALMFVPAGERIVRAEVEQEFASKVYAGQKAQIRDDATDAGEWTGTVLRVSDWYTQRRSVIQEPLQFNDVRTMEVVLKIDDAKEPLRIGQRVRVILSGMKH